MLRIHDATGQPVVSRKRGIKAFLGLVEVSGSCDGSMGAKGAISPKRLAKPVTRHHFGASNHTKINRGRGFTPDPTGGAYSAPPDSLAGGDGG